MDVQSIVGVSPRALAASQPSLDSYETASDGWAEKEYRVDLGHSAVEGGYWTGEAGSVSFESWPYSELCVILKGRVAVEDRSGVRVEYGVGESFLIPQGFSGIWHTLETTEKIFIGVQRERERRCRHPAGRR